MLLLVIQTSLVASGRSSVHRRLGTLGAWLGGSILVIGYATAIAAARRGYNFPAPRVAGLLCIPDNPAERPSRLLGVDSTRVPLSEDCRHAQEAHAARHHRWPSSRGAHPATLRTAGVAGRVVHTLPVGRAGIRSLVARPGSLRLQMGECPGLSQCARGCGDRANRLVACIRQLACAVRLRGSLVAERQGVSQRTRRYEQPRTDWPSCSRDGCDQTRRDRGRDRPRTWTSRRKSLCDGFPAVRPRASLGHRTERAGIAAGRARVHRR